MPVLDTRKQRMILAAKNSFAATLAFFLVKILQRSSLASTTLVQPFNPSSSVMTNIEHWFPECVNKPTTYWRSVPKSHRQTKSSWSGRKYEVDFAPCFDSILHCHLRFEVGHRDERNYYCKSRLVWLRRWRRCSLWQQAASWLQRTWQWRARLQKRARSEPPKTAS